MRVLLSNDDGIAAPGLLAMHEVMGGESEVFVVAPETGQSASAHGITLTAPLAVTRVQLPGGEMGLSVNGRPADCVKLAIRQLLPGPPDLVVSGINDGANVGMNVLYSGTVAAAAEGALLGIPSVAVSLAHAEQMDYAGAAQIAWALIRQLKESGLHGGQLININVPDLSGGGPRGVRVVPQSMLCWDDSFERVAGPEGQEAYWLRGTYHTHQAEADTDIHAHNEGYVTLTPLQFDLTRHAGLAALGGQVWRLPDRQPRRHS